MYAYSPEELAGIEAQHNEGRLMPFIELPLIGGQYLVRFIREGDRHGIAARVQAILGGDRIERRRFQDRLNGRRQPGRRLGGDRDRATTITGIDVGHHVSADHRQARVIGHDPATGLNVAVLHAAGKLQRPQRTRAPL